MTIPLGATPRADGTSFAVRAPEARGVALCLFDAGGRERQVAMAREGDHWVADCPDVRPGQLYGFRADGEWAPDRCLRFDRSKLLVDPYAVALDRRFAWDPRLAAPGEDTAALVPKGIVTALVSPQEKAEPCHAPGGLVYEVNVRGFTMRHPDVPQAQRGTIAALGCPAVVRHLRKLRVSAVELMPVVAWIDERHLLAHGLRNAWGYNPVVPMALDPELAPGGVAELRDAVNALHAAGIGVILDLVFNHTGDGDIAGPTLSFRGLDNRAYAHDADGGMVNDTGTGNTLDCAQPFVRAMVLATLRHFVEQCGVDGFRFDLATILARSPGFDPHAPIFAEIAADPVLADRVMIAEPWDVGPGGYQLGRFPASWLEWNDRYRDDIRRFWRNDASSAGAAATRIAGSADIFGGTATRTVNFVSAHDGFTIADLVAYEGRHNEANGEKNRDGHGANYSWNNGVEGPTEDPAIRARRQADARALLATLFASRGTIMLTAGDEFGRTQGGNNNAYAQDNETSWLDWERRDRALEEYVCGLAAMRVALPELADPAYHHDTSWCTLDGAAMTPADWDRADLPGFEMRLPAADGSTVAVRFDRRTRRCTAERRPAAAHAAEGSRAAAGG